MKFISSIALLGALLASAVSAQQTVSVSYDQKYDVAGSSLTTVACSDGENGLIHRGFSTFGSLPRFPNIGGAPTVPGWNSPNCGNCYRLTYKDKSINVIAIDAAPGGFNIALAAMDKLTGNLGVELGRIQATYTLVADAECGL